VLAKLLKRLDRNTQETSKKSGEKHLTVKTNHKLVKRAFEIACLDGSERLNKRIFFDLMQGASVGEVEAVLQYLSSPKIGLYQIDRNDVCVNKQRLCCSHCRHVEKSDGWHNQSNRCSLSNVVLDKDISKAGICGDFCPVYLETELKNRFWVEGEGN
jgi:hypothetical protein